jgi:hypothetical protein
MDMFETIQINIIITLLLRYKFKLLVVVLDVYVWHMAHGYIQSHVPVLMWTRLQRWWKWERQEERPRPPFTASAVTWSGSSHAESLPTLPSHLASIIAVDVGFPPWDLDLSPLERIECKCNRTLQKPRSKWNWTTEIADILPRSTWSSTNSTTSLHSTVPVTQLSCLCKYERKLDAFYSFFVHLSS